ncbi:MAG: hypothetical protein K8R69_05925 [Deltaproteobacteria bacterium]|nr:hypothetical protein [Deltaproteobacteria bacterium]
MEILSNIGSFFSDLFHRVECYFQPEAQACTTPSREAADHFEPIPPLEHARLEELIRESQPVRVGCYIEMHRVPDFNAQRMEELIRQHPPAPAPRH